METKIMAALKKNVSYELAKIPKEQRLTTRFDFAETSCELTPVKLQCMHRAKTELRIGAHYMISDDMLSCKDSGITPAPLLYGIAKELYGEFEEKLLRCLKLAHDIEYYHGGINIDELKDELSDLLSMTRVEDCSLPKKRQEYA